METVCQRGNDSFLVRGTSRPPTTSKQRRFNRNRRQGHRRNDQFMTNAITKERSRIAFCECGAQLAGDSRGQLFAAAQ
ncbi:MAG: hypothetical protein ACXVVK_07725, partial [Solirubrobacteraceae bacterium]